MHSHEASDPSAPTTTSTSRWIGRAAEIAVSLTTAALFTVLCIDIDVEPLERIGQVSGLAAIGLRYAVIALALIAALVIAARVRGGKSFAMAERLTCAAFAGLATGMIAGGVLVALRGTPWGLNGRAGDAGVLITWIDSVRRGHHVPPGYPPLSIHAMARYADLLDLKSGYALKHMQIIGTALMGPATYLCWRLVLRPGWALGIGLVASMPLIDASPYKPYGNLVLLLFVPLIVWFLDVLRHAADHTGPSLARRGALLGAAMGILCLTYSGWFPWSAPGVLFAALVLFPWRGGLRKGLVLCGFAAAMFAAVAGRYVHGVLTDPTGIVDNYIYFDVGTEPAYIAMYRGDLPGPVALWPPLGELGGVGVFTLLLVTGLGLSVVLGRGRTLVIAAGSLVAGAWLLRFHYASLLWQTKLVQLFPRTTAEIVHCLLLLCGYAVYLAVERIRGSGPGRELDNRSALIGAVCGLALLFASTGSAISDHYMPNADRPISPGWLAWTAHKTPI